MEKQVSHTNHVPFYKIASGKWRRYFDWRNFTDPFKTLWGIGQALVSLAKLKPSVIFSKGGFVSFPVVIAGWMLRIPIIAHESDIIPGLTTRLCLPFVTKQCLGFIEGKKHIKKYSEKLIVTGIPLRARILNGEAQKGLNFLEIKEKTHPLLLILGGSLGAMKINEVIIQSLAQLTKNYTVVHMTGAGKEYLSKQHNYLPYASFKDELADIYQAADIIVSRAGATTLAEILTIHKPAILIPLGRDQSRGDQIINAKTFSHLPSIRVLAEENLSSETLLKSIKDLEQNQSDITYSDTLSHKAACNEICQLILDHQ